MSAEFQHAILFTGHMIDAPDRASPRFPARAEPAARNAIRAALKSILAVHRGPALGLAGGASGGDILFHELCFELGVPTRLCLALPLDQSRDISVAPAGPAWIRRFDRLIDRLGSANIYILADSVHADPSLNIWARANLWMLDEAIAAAPKRTLLALWDGKPGDGPGGTEHLVTMAPSLGVEVFPPIATQPLFA
jgi:hypothetical protein